MSKTKNSPTVFNRKKRFLSKQKNPMVILFSHIGYKIGLEKRANCFALFFCKKVDDIVSNSDQKIFAGDIHFMSRVTYFAYMLTLEDCAYRYWDEVFLLLKTVPNC